ncbi:MAG TPA: DNA polymerase sliding clamp, partial [Methanoculleus sp.]|nr:DNA polymerase sliding clamp [Methanoculleus sp.]
MLKATIDAEIFRESIDAIAALVTECRVHTQEDMIWTRSVDTANVAMVTLELQSTAFTSFSATGGELGLDVAKLKNILAMIGKGDALTLQLQDNDRKLELSFGSYRYSITLLDVNTIRKDPNPPAVNLPGKAVIP